MKRNQFSIFTFIIFTITILSSCESIKLPRTEYIQIADMSIESDTTTLDLKRENLSDITPLYEFKNLTLVDLRDNIIEPEDILNFIEAKPNCQVIWSVPVGNHTFDNTTDTICLEEGFNLTSLEIDNFIKYFNNLKTIQLSNYNINSENYNLIKKEYSQIDFSINVIICNNIYDGKSTSIDLSNCSNIDEDELIENLKYFSEVTAVLFGENVTSNDFIDKLKGEYENIDFIWNSQLAQNKYLSNETEIDISGNEVSDLEAFKKQLNYFQSLTYIDMCDCGLSNIQMEELITEYPQIKFVWKIRVGSWEMRTDVKAFGTCYSGDFEGGTFVGDQGFFLYPDDAANLKYCKDLIALDIGHQYYIYDYSFLKELPNIKYLIVALSNFEDMSVLVDMKELEFLEIFNTNVSDLSPLLELPNLKYLNCSQILIESVDYLTELKQLEVLWLCNCKYISRAEATIVLESLPDCYVNITAQGSTREGWRSYDNQGYVDMREALDMPLAFLTDN